MKKLITTIKLALGVAYMAAIQVPFLKAQLWFIKNRKLIGELVNDILEVITMLMLIGNVWFGTMEKALYYMGFLILMILWDIRKKKNEVNLRTDSEMVIGMLKAFVENNTDYALVKKEQKDARFSYSETKTTEEKLEEAIKNQGGVKLEDIKPSDFTPVAPAQRRVS